MRTDSGKTVSAWMSVPEAPTSPTLLEDVRADVCVVGAGIAGLTTAYLLVREGKTVVVLDDGPIGGGMTCRTTAHLSNAIDDRYAIISRLHGDRGSRLAAESHGEAITRIEAIAGEENIECDFSRIPGYLFMPPGESPELLDHEYEAAHRAGLIDVDRLPRAPFDCFDTGPCLRFPRQGQIHPMKYMVGLAEAIQRRGGRIFSRTHATRIEGGTLARVETTTRATVSCDAVVVATNVPVVNLVSIHIKQAAYLTYVIAARVPKGSITPGLYWDTADPYHYVRLQPLPPTPEMIDEDLLIVGGEDHRTGQEDDGESRFQRLEAWTLKRFPMVTRVDYKWSGQVMETLDGLAYIGKNPGDQENVYIATGDSGMGMTHGTIAGILLTDQIMGRFNPWTDLYNPSRLTLRAAKDFFRENISTASQYTDWVTAGDIDDAEQVAPGSGAILRKGLTKLAVHRDETGQLHVKSAVCRHLGCIVNWNSCEKTWDCPCHGSRYDATGRVMNGPANQDLAQPDEGKMKGIAGG